MNTITKWVSVLAAVAASSSVFAQTAPENPAFVGSSGLLGQRYAEYGLGFIDVKDRDADVFAAGVTVNLPVAPSIDVGLNYSYGWLEGDTSVDTHDLSVDGIYYLDSGKLKPFGGLSLGYSWNNWDDSANWGVFGGAEYQINSQIVVSASVGYDDDFENGDDGAFDGTVRGNYWFTKTVSAFAAVSFIEGGHRGFAVGASLKF